jgi:two-component system sensor kinase FixL
MDREPKTTRPREASADRLAALYARQATSSMLLLLDRLGQIISCNIGGKTADRFNADGVVGRSHAVFYPPDEVIEGRPNSDLDDAARIGVLVRDAWRMRGDGTEYLARLSITPSAMRGRLWASVSFRGT